MLDFKILFKAIVILALNVLVLVAIAFLLSKFPDFGAIAILLFVFFCFIVDAIYYGLKENKNAK